MPAVDSALPVPGGVGVDVEELAGLNRFDDSAIARATARWLKPQEQDWCARQPSAAEALIIVLCCREAAFKCGCSRLPVHELGLRIEGGPAVGRAEVAPSAAAAIELVWWVADGRILAVAAAGPPAASAEILGRLETTLTTGAPCPRSN